MNIQDLVGQLSKSSNPLGAVMGMLPNNNMKSIFSSIANSGSNEERAQKIADLCNRNGITKEQLTAAMRRNRF